MVMHANKMLMIFSIAFSSSYDWNFGQDFHLFIGVANNWNHIVVHFAQKKSYS